MSMKLAAPALLLPLVLAAILHPAAVVAVGDGTPAGPGGGGFSLRLVPSPGWNRTIHVDDDGFVHLNEHATTALRPPMHTQVGGMYSVVTSVGTGAGRRTYVLALDMTTSVLWMQCKPVQEPFAQQPPPFEPAKSPSFRPVPGNNAFCLPPDHEDHPTVQDPCKFHSIRLDGSTDMRGVLSNETLAFAASGRQAEVAGVVIGCTHNSNGFKFNSHGVLAGVLGLGRQAPSLIWTLGQHRHGAVQVHRFSYCLPNHGSSDHHSFLRFGDDVPHTQHMVSTKIMYMAATAGRDFSAYFVSLTGVSVAGKPLHDIKELFRRHVHGQEWTSGCAFDAGTPTMVMIMPAYNKLKDAVVRHLKPLGLQIVSGQYHLCFRATSQLRQHLPTVTLQFAETEARLVLPPQRLFVAVGHDICLAVVRSYDITIIGAMQQVDKRFVYDVRNGRIYFAPENACHADAGHQI
ncbi:aspartyl protease family protein 2-like [Hordeum vulgare subsp. vulgare]|uniref:Peptidase A1 domain-containing protein n=1 Tax=Hordeum vulgare subsp. vulgare TaxID=112509 RepID=A0A8I7BAF5_HORVV|nr:aspartyl protease family protein 2-like [Hordeum vulgare subsp. vulgare]